MDEMVCTFHHAKNKNNYKDSIRKLKKLEGYLKRGSGRQLTQILILWSWLVVTIGGTIFPISLAITKNFAFIISDDHFVFSMFDHTIRQ